MNSAETIEIDTNAEIEIADESLLMVWSNRNVTLYLYNAPLELRSGQFGWVFVKRLSWIKHNYSVFPCILTPGTYDGTVKIHQWNIDGAFPQKRSEVTAKSKLFFHRTQAVSVN